MAQAAFTEHRPPLSNGDMLSRSEFERRWELHPEIKKAELIDGVVYLDVTVSPEHGQCHALVMGWLTCFWARHLELQVLDNTTVRLAGANDLQPDALLRRREGGTSHLSGGAVEGPPELVVEIAASSAAYDMHVKKEAYRRGGVREYVAWQQYENRLDWFVLEGESYASRVPDEHGIIESRGFPGLRLDVAALLAGDLPAVLTALA